MKIKKATRLAITVIAIAAISCGITSCKKNSGSSAPMGTFYFQLNTYIDTNKVVDTAILYRDSSGRHFSLSVAQFFIYNVVLQNANGTSYKIDNAYILKDIDSIQYVIGSAPPGTYNTVSFNVGLDAETNALSPSVFAPADSYIPTGNMWYGNTTQGYIFMQLQGYADTTATQTGINPVHFSCNIASAANLETVTMPVRGAYPPYTLAANGTCYINITCDYGKLLSAVNFKTQDSTDTYYFNPALATAIAGNIPNMFRYGQ